MNQNWSEQLMNVINQIAEKLGVAAEKLYPILRKQAMIDGIEGIAYIIFGTILIWVTIKFALKIVKKKDKYEELICQDWDIEWLPYSLCVGIPIIIGVILITTSLNTVLTAFINPDWYIINNILGQFIK